MHQPSVGSVIEKMSRELPAKAVALLAENGEILERSGSLPENEWPNLAALVAAMASASRSFGELTGAENPKHLGCDFDNGNLTVVRIGADSWLMAFHPQVLNPGLFRRNVRKFAQTLEKLGLSRDGKKTALTQRPSVIATPVPGVSPALFENITDEEIDTLFTEARPGGRA